MPQFFPTGAFKDIDDKRDIPFAALLPPTVEVVLPSQFSRRAEIQDIMKVFTQKYGSCVGGAGRYIMQYFHFKQTGEKLELAERFLYGRAKELDGNPGAEGTWPRTMLQVMFGAGAPLYSRWPQEPSPTHQDFIAAPPDDVREEAVENVMTGGFVRVSSYDELKKAIYLHGPVFVTLPVFDTYDMVGPDGKVHPSTGNGNRGLHENIAIGWNDATQEIEVMNQWGEGWADHGFAFISRNYSPTGAFPLMDMWSVTEQVDSTGTQGAPIELGYPVETTTPFITQNFGDNKANYAQFGMLGHNGTDFRTKGTNRFIVAAADGEIISCNPTDGGYGMAVRVKHPWGQSIYGHNSQFLVLPTDSFGAPTKVSRGQRIAIAGSTGFSSAEHCHFGIRINGVKNPGFFDWVNPAPFFKEQKMTKYFRVQQGAKSGMMILEGFSGTIVFENNWSEYQKLLQITGLTLATPVVNLPEGKFLRVDDHGKLGIIIVDGFAGTVLFENSFADYQTLLQISGMSLQNPVVSIP